MEAARSYLCLYSGGENVTLAQCSVSSCELTTVSDDIITIINSNYLSIGLPTVLPVKGNLRMSEKIQT